MTDHLLIMYFHIYILMEVLGLEMTEHLLMIILLQLTLIPVKEHK